MYIVYGHEKEYKVLLAKRPDRGQIEAWKRGVVLEDGYKTQRLGNLKPRQWRYLTTEEVAGLQKGDVKKRKKTHRQGDGTRQS